MNEIGKLGNTTLEIRPGTGWGSKRPDMERALSLDDIASPAGSLGYRGIADCFQHDHRGTSGL